MKKLARLFLLALMLAPALSQGQTTTVSQSVNASAFPWWVVRKVGYPVLLESDFTGTFPNTKYGVLLGGGGGGSVTADTANLLWGGKGSAKLLTEAVNLSGAEIKATIAPVARCGDLLAFEQKFAVNFAQAATEFQVGLESRTNASVYQARFSATCSGASASCTWTYETYGGGGGGGALVYKAFTTLPGSPPAAATPSPVVNATAGTPVGWTRIVIDPCARKYVSFEIPNISTGGTTVYDMSSVKLPINGTATRALYLPFAYVITHAAAAEPAYTTDWAMSIIPRGMDPNPPMSY